MNSIFYRALFVFIVLSGCQKPAIESNVFQVPCTEEIYFKIPKVFGEPKYMRDELNQINPSEFCSPQSTISTMSMVFKDTSTVSVTNFTVILYKKDQLFSRAIHHNFKYFKETDLYNTISNMELFMGRETEVLTGNYRMADQGYTFSGLMKGEFGKNILMEIQYQAQCKKGDLENHKQVFLDIISSFHNDILE